MECWPHLSSFRAVCLLPLDSVFCQVEFLTNGTWVCVVRMCGAYVWCRSRLAMHLCMSTNPLMHLPLPCECCTLASLLTPEEKGRHPDGSYTRSHGMKQLLQPSKPGEQLPQSTFKSEKVAGRWSGCLLSGISMTT